MPGDRVSGIAIAHEAQKIFERMRDDLTETLANEVPPSLRPNPEEIAHAMLQVIAREIAEHRLRTLST